MPNQPEILQTAEVIVTGGREDDASASEGRLALVSAIARPLR